MPSDTSNSPDTPIEDLLEQFSTGSPSKRRGMIAVVEGRVEELARLGKEILSYYDPSGDDWAAGWILQVLKRHQQDSLLEILTSDANGWFNTASDVGIDYSTLQDFLLAEQFEDADRFTSAALRKLAGSGAESRGYVYFSEVHSIPSNDLISLDRLWIAYSQGRFGFSIQAHLLESLGGRYERLWERIGWKKAGVWTRYPTSFNWSLAAPEGHMPLVNQLRGVRLMDAILNHPGLIARRNT